MILQQKKNTPVTSPQFADMTAALAIYRTFTGEADASMDLFVEFLCVPGADRDSFLNLFGSSATDSELYIKISYHGIE